MEVVGDVDLDQLPIITHCEHDLGAFICPGVLLSRNLDTGVVSSVTIDATAIAGQSAGATTDVRFETLGLTIALNTNFTDVDITTANSTAAASGGNLDIAAGGIVIKSVDLKSTVGIADLGAAADVTFQVWSCG